MACRFIEARVLGIVYAPKSLPRGLDYLCGFIYLFITYFL